MELLEDISEDPSSEVMSHAFLLPFNHPIPSRNFQHACPVVLFIFVCLLFLSSQKLRPFFKLFYQ